MDDLVVWLREQIAQKHDLYQLAAKRPRSNKPTLRGMLDEVEAYTAILDEHLPRTNSDGEPECTTCVFFGTDEDEGGNRFRYREHDDWPCSTVRALALVFRHHDGYREEWKP